MNNEINTISLNHYFILYNNDNSGYLCFFDDDIYLDYKWNDKYVMKFSNKQSAMDFLNTYKTKIYNELQAKNWTIKEYFNLSEYKFNYNLVES